jgi:ribonuclease J
MEAGAGMNEPFLTITPLGGLGEVGLNCQMWETARGMVLVDCGIMFPDDLQFGVDVVIPPLQPILERREQLLGVILTHGHEDHIGAVPWLLSYITGLTLYGSPFTLSLVEHKLSERDLMDRARLAPVTPRDTVELGDLRFRFVPVSHSIPQGYALAVESPVGRVIHTGDFKVDSRSVGGHATNLEAFREFAGKGARLLLSDSTNIEAAGHSRPEGMVKEALRDIFAAAQGRIVITLFSSHIERIESVFEICREFERAVVISGRSLINNIEKAREHGFLQRQPQLFADQTVPDLPPDRVVILATGSQGEPWSALARIAMGEHRRLHIQEGDTVIMSSRAIAGNAQAVNRMINQMYKLGARVMHEGVHATGHAHREELRAMLAAARPDVFVPMHGECRHLAQHRDLALECGVAPGNALLLYDGQPLTLYPDRFELGDRIPAASLLVDGKGVGDVGALVLRERQLLRDAGVVVVSLILDAKTGELLHGPDIVSRGFVFARHFDHILDDAKCLVRDQLEDRPENDDAARLGERIRACARAFFRKVMGRDPVVLPIITEI